MPETSPDHVREPVPVIAGPTAVGKSGLGLRLAEQLSAEIVSADSRQVYRGLSIGTAKPTTEELARVPHHFIDELEPREPFSAGTFAHQAWQRIEAIHRRGHRAFVIGGSTLYLEALVYGIADVPSVPVEIRERLLSRLEAEGPMRLFAELERLDPNAASTLDPSKTSRLVRALEVVHATGRPISSYWSGTAKPPFDFNVVVLTRKREQLYRRINRRVDEMIGAGLVAEVQRLLTTAPRSPALRTIGYQELAGHLTGTITFEQAIEAIKQNTRRYAKRQLTWFRRWSDATWFSLTDADPASALERLSHLFGTPPEPPAGE